MKSMIFSLSDTLLMSAQCVVIVVARSPRRGFGDKQAWSNGRTPRHTCHAQAMHQRVVHWSNSFYRERFQIQKKLVQKVGNVLWASV
jgi:hypothetical protein